MGAGVLTKVGEKRHPRVTRLHRPSVDPLSLLSSPGPMPAIWKSTVENQDRQIPDHLSAPVLLAKNSRLSGPRFSTRQGSGGTSSPGVQQSQLGFLHLISTN